MTGMKEGAGEDPFAGDDDEETDESVTEPEPTPGTETQTETINQSSVDETASSATGSTSRHQSQPPQSIQIPYKFRRDGVQDGRDRVPLFLQSETKSAERDALRELEDRFDDDVSLTDLREALVKTGLQHLDEVEEQLAAWGYGMTFDD